MKTLILSLVILLLVSCNQSDEVNNFTPLTITPVLIGKGNLYGNGMENIPQQNVVITNQTEFNALIVSMDTANNVSNSFTSTTIDFSSYNVIAVFDSIKNNEGYRITIANITENVNNIIVSILTAYSPQVTSVITQPYHIVRIPKSTKLIVFQ